VSETFTAKDPLRPIEFIVSFALRLAVGLLLLGTISVVVSAVDGGSRGVVVGAWGDRHPCLQVPQDGLEIGSTANAGPIGGTSVLGLKRGVALGVPRTYTVCVDQLSGSDRALFSVPVLLHWLWSLGFLWLTLRLIRRARKRGLFTREVARATTHLGWYILGGWATVDLAAGVLRAIAISHLVSEYSMIGGILGNLSWSWAVVIGGFGVISIGRVMQRTVPMREELEATV
jgi:hypothetical protein